MLRPYTCCKPGRRTFEPAVLGNYIQLSKQLMRLFREWPGAMAGSRTLVGLNHTAFGDRYWDGLACVSSDNKFDNTCLKDTVVQNCPVGICREAVDQSLLAVV